MISKNIEHEQQKLSYVKAHSNVSIKTRFNVRQFLLFVIFLLVFLVIALQFVLISEYQKSVLQKANVVFYASVAIMMFQLFNVRVQYMYIKWEMSISKYSRISFVVAHSIVGLAMVLIIVQQIITNIFIIILIYFAFTLFLIAMDLILFISNRNKFINQFGKIILLFCTSLFTNAFVFVLAFLDISEKLVTINDTFSGFFTINNILLIIILGATTIGWFANNLIIKLRSKLYFFRYNNSIYSLMEIAHPVAIIMSIGFVWMDLSVVNFTSLSALLAYGYLAFSLLISIYIIMRIRNNKGDSTTINLIFSILLLIGCAILAISIVEADSSMTKNGFIFMLMGIGLMIFNTIISFCSYMVEEIETSANFSSFITGVVGKVLALILMLDMLDWEYFILKNFAPLDVIIVVILLIWSLIYFFRYLIKYIIMLVEERE